MFGEKMPRSRHPLESPHKTCGAGKDDEAPPQFDGFRATRPKCQPQRCSAALPPQPENHFSPVPKNDYRVLTSKLLEVEELEEAPLLPPTTNEALPPHLNIGDLTDEDDQRVCCEVCDRTAMTPCDWAKLSEQERIPWVEMAIAKKSGVFSSLSIPSEVGPPKALLMELSPQERKILEFLWDRETASIEDLEDHLWDEPRKPDAVRKAVYRLDSRLRLVRASQIKVYRDKHCVHLVRISPQGQ